MNLKMILLLIMTRLFFIALLLHDCIAPKIMYTPNDDPELNEWRRVLFKAVAENDPCGKIMWPLMEDSQKLQAKTECEEAFNVFCGLPFEEQEKCQNAAAPACRPLARCDNLMYGCTFECGEERIVHTTNPITGVHEHVLQYDQQTKDVKEIADELAAKAPKQKRKYKTRVPYGTGPSGLKAKNLHP